MYCLDVLRDKIRIIPVRCFFQPQIGVATRWNETETCITFQKKEYDVGRFLFDWFYHDKDYEQCMRTKGKIILYICKKDGRQTNVQTQLKKNFLSTEEHEFLL